MGTVRHRTEESALVIDFLVLPGLTEWIDTQERLNELLPPPSGFNRSIANLIKLML